MQVTWWREGSTLGVRDDAKDLPAVPDQPGLWLQQRLNLRMPTRCGEAQGEAFNVLSYNPFYVVNDAT